MGVHRLTLSRATGDSSSDVSYSKDKGALKLCGRFIDMISHVSSSMPPDATFQDCIEICRQWEPLNAYVTPYITGGPLIEAFVSAISASYTAEMFKEFTHSKMEDLISEYKRVMMREKDSDQTLSRFAREMHSFLKGRLLFRTEKGYIGVGPVSGRVGDHVCVILGGDLPLILRSASRVLGCHEVGGGSFIPGLQFGEGLLGPLPSGWSCSFAMSLLDSLEFYGPNGEATRLDPRAGPMPAGWEVCEATGGKDEYLGISFKNHNTGTHTNQDPRITSENLREICIELKDIILV